MKTDKQMMVGWLLMLGCGLAFAADVQPDAATSRPADKVAAKPAEKAADKATDKPTEKPTDKPTDKAGDKAAAKPADKQAEPPAEQQATAAEPNAKAERKVAKRKSKAKAKVKASTDADTAATSKGADAAPAQEAPAAHAAPAAAPADPAQELVIATTPVPQASRVRVKDRAAAAVAVANEQATPANAAPVAAAPASAAAEPVQAAPAKPAEKPADKPEHKHADKQDHPKDHQKDHKHEEQPAVAVAAAPAELPAAVSECNPPFKSEVMALFDRWNAALRSGDPKKVVAQYAPDSILLPTLSNRARFTAAEKEDYFRHFLQRRPEGKVDDRVIDVDCHSATDTGLYTFRFSDGTQVKARYSFAYKKVNGEWLISSHHSSAMPEKTAVAAEAKPAAASSDNGAPKAWVRFP